jgi:hypothetical protein
MTSAMSPRAHAGVGLKPQHYAEALAAPADGLWFEVHAENYMAEGGPRLAWLDAIARDKPVSLHGVGLSLAADEAPDPTALQALRRLVDRFQPVRVSEHLAWSLRQGVYVPDLLPFPRTRSALQRIGDNVQRVQDALGRPILVENPSLYLPLKGHELDEVEFLERLARRTGCGLLVDVNNVFVSSHNLGYAAEAYLDAAPGELVGEIHLAGHAVDNRISLLVDSHDAPVAEPVWRLYERLIRRIGSRPTLIERDGDIPPFAALLAERERAEGILSMEPADA